MKTPSGLSKSVGDNQNKNNVLETREEFSIKENLTIDDLKALSVGDPIEEMYTVLRKEHGYYGSGYIGYKYYLSSGETIIIYEHSGKVEQIRNIEKDGNYKIIAKYGGVSYEQDYSRYEPSDILFSFDGDCDECKFSLLFFNASA